MICILLEYGNQVGNPYFQQDTNLLKASYKTPVAIIMQRRGPVIGQLYYLQGCWDYDVAVARPAFLAQ